MSHGRPPKTILHLDLPILSLNKLLRQHWQIRRRHIAKWGWAIKTGFIGSPPPAQGRMKVRITSYRARFLDHDNLVGGAKPLVDAMCRQGLIKDDSPAWVEIDYQQIKVGRGEQKTVVVLEAA